MNEFHIIYIYAVPGEAVADKSFVVRRRVVSAHVERLVKELVVRHVVADYHTVSFVSRAPSV